MSIPVEKRELGDGWVLSCHGQDGGGLTLTDVTIKRENLVCQIMGGDTLFFPMFADGEPENAMRTAAPMTTESLPRAKVRHEDEEESILDHIKVLILNAQRHGCWKVGVGGVSQVRLCIVVINRCFCLLTALARLHVPSLQLIDMLRLSSKGCQFPMC
jgi:hypothetical protein